MPSWGRSDMELLLMGDVWGPDSAAWAIGTWSLEGPAGSDGVRSDSLCAKASSTSLPSLAVRLFLAGSASRTQLAALSADRMSAISATSLSRTAAVCSVSKMIFRLPEDAAGH